MIDQLSKNSANKNIEEFRKRISLISHYDEMQLIIETIEEIIIEKDSIKLKCLDNTND